jgi:hypothetical protein
MVRKTSITELHTIAEISKIKVIFEAVTKARLVALPWLLDDLQGARSIPISSMNRSTGAPNFNRSDE